MKLKKSEMLKYTQELNNDFDIKYLSGNNDRYIYPHFHEWYEMLFIVEGKVTYMSGGHNFALKSGDIMFHKAYAKHCPMNIDPDTPYERINLQITSAKLESLSRYGLDLAECFEQESVGVFRFPYYAQNTIRMILGKIMSVMQEKPFGHAILADIYLTELFVKVSEFFYSEETTVPSTGEIQATQMLNMIDQYILENIESQISIEALASYICMNKYSFMRYFKDLAGCTVYQYIINKRLEAAETLIYSGATFSNAAERCGFSDYSCFYRSFMNKYKQSPQKYFEKSNK